MVDMSVDIIDSEIFIPELPDNCDADAHTALAALNDKDIEFEDCLSYSVWIESQLQESCEECLEGIMSEIDF